jgi:hypothetical protein
MTVLTNRFTRTVGCAQIAKVKERKCYNIVARILVFVVLTLGPIHARAELARLSNTPSPVAIVRNVSVPKVQDAIVGFMLPSGRTPVRQDANVLVYEYPLSFWQSIGVQMLQGNSGWQQPKGRQTFTMAQQGNNVMLTVKLETVATNMFNASNSIELTNPVVYNENYLALQLIAAMADGRIVAGDHNALGITAYEKPTRRTKKIGAVVKGVVPGGPADKAGIVAGDVITAIGGMPTAEQSPDAIAMMGFLQEGVALLQVKDKGEVRVVKRSRPDGPPSAPVLPSAAATPVSASPTAEPMQATPVGKPKTWWDQHRDD